MKNILRMEKENDILTYEQMFTETNVLKRVFCFWLTIRRAAHGCAGLKKISMKTALLRRFPNRMFVPDEP